ncbi:MAG: hypothetical protein FWE33_00880 [Defluviitaleaceae bacterium]|nr:hypothetical protein [Defluviitaleaceae bacterium]
MKIDTSIVEIYLNSEPSVKYSKHWVYFLIEDGKHIFLEPDTSRIAEVTVVYSQLMLICQNFRFLNTDLIVDIFGDTSTVVQNVNVLLVVGCPSMYDAMVRHYNNEQYIIFDLINFANYLTQGYNLNEIARNFLTYEIVHVLINNDYPASNLDYYNSLNYIAFHEGFAHLLSFEDNMTDFTPTDEHNGYWSIAKSRLAVALQETNPQTQQQYLVEANSGKYWDKFAAISAFGYLISSIKSLKSIYNQGWHSFAEKIYHA